MEPTSAPSSSQQPPTERVYQFRVQLQYIKPPIWRRFQVVENTTFLELHNVLQNVMGWKFEHLFQFAFGDNLKRWGWGGDEPTAVITQLWSDATNFEKDHLDAGVLMIGQFFQEGMKTKCVYEYDFGCGWEHKVTLEKIVPKTKGKQYPVCLSGRRACPQENDNEPPDDHDPEAFNIADIDFTRKQDF